jgi:hypothetical protein
MTLSLLATAELAEAKLHHLLSHPTNPDDQFQLSSSRLYGVTITNNEAKLTHLSSHDDVYDLLSKADRKVAKSYEFTAVVTTGWAAPLPKDFDAEVGLDTPPSQHPEKRRVRLVIVATRGDVVSVLRFQDEPDDTITDEGGATGSLNDAIRNFMR